MPITSMSASSCARASSAAEARFRIDAPIAPVRAARIVALDDGAAGVGRRAAGQPWARATFFVCEAAGPGAGSVADPADSVLLRGIDGSPAVLSEQLTDADVVVMIATQDVGAQCALVIGRACAARGIMTAGLVLGYDSDDAVAALRPHARVLLHSADEGDVVDLLTALRA